MRPSYDAFGWLVWGQQVLHWKLNTDGAPSWKPLTFLFTLPYALTGRDSQVYLWMLTATAGAFAGSVFAARIAFRLVGPTPARPWAGYFAGAVRRARRARARWLFAARADRQLRPARGRDLSRGDRQPTSAGARALRRAPRPALHSGVPRRGRSRASMRLAGRTDAPDAEHARMRSADSMLIPVAWFLMPGLTSHSWFSAGDLALNKATVIHGSKFIGVLGRLGSLYEWPMQIAVLLGIVIAGIRRDRLSRSVSSPRLHCGSRPRSRLPCMDGRRCPAT